ncbi:MAG TPA: RHS repeat-associated core domain-containing protein, partial [Thermoanaerobaculia bacterium]|nr:RHS repeat-associated core domain-containing protein [Thermoanaerobaculia bacterium]
MVRGVRVRLANFIAAAAFVLFAAPAAATEQPSFHYSFGRGDELERVVRFDTAEITEYTSGVYGRILSRNGIAFSYDRSGRRTEDDRFSYVWNWRGELVSLNVKKAPPGSTETSGYAGHRVEYTYDALGRLLNREHRGATPANGTEADRPFIELRELVWEGQALATEVAYGRPDKTQPRWRRTYIPGPRGLDDAVQLLVEVDASFPGPYAGQPRVYSYIRDEMGTVIGLVAEDESSPAEGQPPLPLRYRYTPYGESHAEVGPELRLALFVGDRRSVGDVQQVVLDPGSAAAGAVVLHWSLPLDAATLSSGIAVERSVPGVGWQAIPDVTVAPIGGVDETTVAVLPATGWPRQATYRLRITSSLRDAIGRPFGVAQHLEWTVPAAPAEGPIPSIVYREAFPLRFDSSLAASETAGGRFPGGQAALFQGAWTDPVSGLSYHRARWYDARNLSFLTEDPAGPVDSPNLYAFVGWQPTMGTDPLGTCWSSGGPTAFVQCMTRALRGEEPYREILRHESRQAGKRVAMAVGKEVAATAAEELSPAGVVNGLTTAGGYDVLRQEKVEGFIPRTLGLAGALPGVPSLIRKAGDAATLARHADDVPIPHGGGWSGAGGSPAGGSGSPLRSGKDVPYDPRGIQGELEALYP